MYSNPFNNYIQHMEEIVKVYRNSEVTHLKYVLNFYIAI